MFKCTVCGINATSERNLHEHMRGWSHFRKLESLKVAEKSVYIRGFASNLTQDTLQSFLEEHIGGVNWIWLSKDITYALVEFQEPADALKALQTPDLTLSGKRLVIKPRHLPSDKAGAESAPKQKGQPSSTQDSGKMKSERKNERKSLLDVLGVGASEILQFAELEAQLQHLVQLNRISPTALKSQLVVTFQLLKLLRPSFPHCLLVPFGSFVSGLATHNSDCDLCLLLSPPPTLTALLTGENYFSPTLLPIVERLEREHGVKLCPPPLPPSEVEMSQEVMEEGSGGQQTSSGVFMSSVAQLSKRERAIHNRPVFEQVATPLRNSKDYQDILLLLHARCPIIRFVHKPTSLQCDVSINSVLGSLNSRLVRSYCEFDPRVTPLISILKLWSQVVGVPKKQLNSYGISLMVIYFLQRCTSPVLPCLQRPEHQWPRNMQWYGQALWREEVSRNQSASELVGPWDVSFTPHKAFLPSSNTASTVSLLCEFFDFYSKFSFKKVVVSIKDNRDKILTPEEAIRQAGEHVNQRHFNTPLIVQDPFELSHNVTKMLTSGTFRRWREAIAQASQVLKGELDREAGGSILPVFEVSATKPDLKMPSWTVPLVFSMERTVQLLQHTHPTLAQQLPELDLNNRKVHNNLSRLMLKVVVKVLETRYGFVCSPVGLNEKGGVAAHGDAEEVTEAVGIGQSSGGGVTEESMEESMEEGLVSGGEGEREREGERGHKRSRASPGEEEMEEEMEVDLKRSKVQDCGVNALDILQGLLRQEPHPQHFTCVVYGNTWLHSRRVRRDGGLTQEASAQALLASAPSQTPVLKMKVYVLQPGQGVSPGAAVSPGAPVSPGAAVSPGAPVSPASTSVEQELCVLKVKKMEGSHEDFFTFLAVLKKVLYSGAEVTQH